MDKTQIHLRVTSEEELKALVEWIKTNNIQFGSRAVNVKLDYFQKLLYQSTGYLFYIHHDFIEFYGYSDSEFLNRSNNYADEIPVLEYIIPALDLKDIYG